jgi:hypothetical protein
MAPRVLRGSPLTALKPKMQPPTVDFVSGSEGAEVYYFMEGMESLLANLSVIPKYYQDIAGYEMANIAADIIADARDNYVPYQDGALRDSGASDEYNPSAGMTIVEIGMWFAGGPAAGMGSEGRKIGHASASGRAAAAGLHVIDPTSYALEQHENPAFIHPVLGPVSDPQYKYLEKPFLKAVPSVLPRIAKAIEDAGGSL